MNEVCCCSSEVCARFGCQNQKRWPLPDSVFLPEPKYIPPCPPVPPAREPYIKLTLAELDAIIRRTVVDVLVKQGLINLNAYSQAIQAHSKVN